MKITLQYGIPTDAWKWLRERPDANFDDAGPRSEAEFLAEISRRLLAGEHVETVLADGVPVGMIGYLPVSPHTGNFHGICFSEAVHGQGIARAGVSMFLERLFGAGLEWVSAGFFADNTRIHQFLKSLGATDVRLLPKHTRRNGVPIDMQVVAIYKENFLCHSADS